jgi:hypothetical protein
MFYILMFLFNKYGDHKCCSNCHPYMHGSEFFRLKFRARASGLHWLVHIFMAIFFYFVANIGFFKLLQFINIIYSRKLTSSSVFTVLQYIYSVFTDFAAHYFSIFQEFCSSVQLCNKPLCHNGFGFFRSLWIQKKKSFFGVLPQHYFLFNNFNAWHHDSLLSINISVD